jgi:hypothetical protein
VTDVVTLRVIKNNGYPIRTIVRLADEKMLHRARLDRQNFKKRLWRIKNQERLRAYNKEWKLKNKEHEAERKRQWREENREHVRAYERRYFQLNPAVREYRMLKNREYRARKRA